MSYFRRYGLSGMSTNIPPIRQPMRPRLTLGSLGDDTSGSGSTLSQPTLVDPTTAAWQQSVLQQLQAGVATLQKAELQKWLQIIATLSIPVAGMVWKAIFKRGGAPTSA